MRRVLLDTGLENRRVAWLRSPTGADELAARTGVDVLVDRCLVVRDQTSVEPGTARELPVSDRDRLLVAVHRMLFGDRVDADAACTACAEPFSLSLTLSALVDAQRATRPPGVHGPDAHGHYRLGEVRFRLPSSADLDRVCALAAEQRTRALLEAVVVSGDSAGHEARIEAAMAAIGPTIDLDLDAICPNCSSRQQPRFSIAAFLARALDNERRFLLREVHTIARAYGWSLDAILELPRGDRHEFVGFIEGERPRAAGDWSLGEVAR